LEDTYADPELFSHNLISSIESSAVNDSYHFSSYQQAPGTGWTIAGIVSTQCGLPLRTFLRNASGDNATGFLNNAVCLGDTLADKGYLNIFMNGADLSFAGKGKFIAKHGYTQNYGGFMGGMSGVNNYGAGYFQTYGRNRSIGIILLLIFLKLVFL
jgi:phosphoglycerol transferase